MARHGDKLPAAAEAVRARVGAVPAGGLTASRGLPWRAVALRPFGAISRRRLLKLTLGAGGLLAGGAGGVLALRGRAPDVEGLHVLSAHEYRTMASLSEAAFPGDAAEGPRLARAFDGYLADEPSWAQSEAAQALMLLELGPLVFERRPVTFSHLSPAERVAHFAAWANADSALRRQVATGFRKFLCLLHYDRPEAWPALGYPGPMIGGGAP